MKKILLLSVAVMFCISNMAQDSINLKMNLEKNKVYRFNSVSEQTTIQTINGNQQTIESKINHSLSIKMIDATAGFIITEVRFDTLMTSTNSMGKTVNYSSVGEGNIKSSETREIMSCIMNRLSKNSLYVKMDFTGRVLEIVNSKMLSDIILKDTSTITLKGPMASAIKTQIVNLISDNTLKTMVESFTRVLPGKKVVTGENWTLTVEANSGGMILDIKTGYHFDGINGNSANITAESEIKAAENAGPMESGGAKIAYEDLKGLTKSSMLVDINTGLVIENKAKTHMAGNLGVSGPGFSMQIPLDINETSKVIAVQ